MKRHALALSICIWLPIPVLELSQAVVPLPIDGAFANSIQRSYKDCVEHLFPDAPFIYINTTYPSLHSSDNDTDEVVNIHPRRHEFINADNQDTAQSSLALQIAVPRHLKD
jgi:hypothetical protein